MTLVHTFSVKNPQMGIISHTLSPIQIHKNYQKCSWSKYKWSMVYNVPSQHENNILQCVHFPYYVHMNELVVYNVP